MVNEKVNEAWDYLVEAGIVSEETMKVVIGINGYTMETINDICYHAAGMDYEQLKEEVY